MIKEVIFLRSIACLAIVLGHSIASSLSWYPHITSEAWYITDSWKMLMQLLLFGTPIFVFISALVLSYSYPNGTPKHFLSKRLIFILIPYVIMGLGYAILASLTQGSFNNLLGNMFDNVVLGQFHGYFIIIIFQFYLLHIVFHKLVNYIRIERLVIYSLIINVIYLQIAGVYLQDTRWGTQLWWFPLCAWIFYYSLAYYLGRNLDKFRSALNRHRWAIGISCILTGALVLTLFHFNVLPSSGSKRIDVLLYTTFTCFFLFYIGSRMKKIPSVFVAISSYSFGIYWLHVFYIQVFHKVYKMLAVDYQQLLNVSGYIIVLFIGSTLLSIATVYLLHKFRFGAYVVGKIGAPYNKSQINHNSVESLKAS